MKHIVTKKEVDSIRFYQGDIRKRTENGNFSEQVKEKGFWGIPKAYKTMNSLLFRGINNEIIRIDEKEGSLNPEILLEIEKVNEVFCDIFRVMCKCLRIKKEENKSIIVYRADRGISVREMKEIGQTISFTSTSKKISSVKDFTKKKELILLEFLLHSSIPYLDFEEILGDHYLFSSQKEILLPPFLKIRLNEEKLSKKECEYEGKYIVNVGNICLPTQSLGIQERELKLKKLIEEKEFMADILEKLNKKRMIDKSKIERYEAWKKIFREIVIENFIIIQSQWL